MDRLTSVQLFIRVVESRSFSRAAQETNVTQPTVTKHIAALEARLGVRLLNRNTRSMRLTEAGEAYYQQCKAIQREVEAADDLVTVLRDGLSGTLRIATAVGFGRRVVMPLALEFMRSYPGVRVDLQFDDAMIDLVEHGIDVSIRIGKLADSSLGSRFLGVNPWITVASPAHIARRGQPQHPAELVHHDCIVYSNVQGDQLWRYTAEDGSVVPVTVSGPLRVNNLSCVTAAALEGVGIAILPQYVANKWLAEGRLVPLLPAFRLPSQEIHAVYPSPRFVPAKVSTWIEFLQARLARAMWMSKADEFEHPGV
jgi:DNA-binding transcriptional LysR family regulator